MTEFHKRSTKSRKNQKAQIEKYFQNRKTPEDQKRLKIQSRERKKARQGKAPRRRDWTGQDDDVELSERMTRHKPQRPPEAHAATPSAEGSAATPDDPRDAGTPGVVMSVSRGRAEVALPHQLVDAQLSPDIAAVQQTKLAVGDDVVVSMHGGVARVETVGPRRTTLSRPDPGNAHRRRVLAANVDIAVLVLSVRRPAFKPGLADRFLVALHEGGVQPVIVANKADLLEDEPARDEILEALAPQRSLGVHVVLVSAQSGEGVAALRTALAGKRSVFVGHSGVGKSSLLNALDPDGVRLTKSGREGDGKGRHTTTQSTLTALPDGMEVIDTPGVRAFGLWHMDRASLKEAFPDLAAHAAGCRFRGCSHLAEPDCAVRSAVEHGHLAGSRYASYQRIHASLEEVPW